MISTKHTAPRAWACSAVISDWEPWLASLDFGQAQNHHGLSPGTKAPSTARDAVPRPAWWPQAVLPHHGLSGSSSSFCSPPSLTDVSWGPFPTIFLSLWTLLSTRTAPLQPGFETLLKQLSQPCFAILRVKKMVRGKRFSKLCCTSTCGQGLYTERKKNSYKYYFALWKELSKQLDTNYTLVRNKKQNQDLQRGERIRNENNKTKKHLNFWPAVTFCEASSNGPLRCMTE